MRLRQHRQAPIYQNFLNFLMILLIRKNICLIQIWNGNYFSILIKYLMKTKRNYRIYENQGEKAFIKQEAMCHKTHCFLFYNLNLYPTPQIVSIYCGLLVFISIFSRIFLICTVTVAISPTDSISQISRNNSSFVNTWFGFSAKR